MATSSKRSIMTLYSGAMDVYSHRVRIVLAEKAVNVDVKHVDPNTLPQDLLELNPYNTVPTLIDRDLILYEPSIIMEYLDERFPHPPLLPVYPITRAKYRLMMHRIEKDWVSHLFTIDSGKKTAAEKARKTLCEHLISFTPIFAKMPYFLSEDFSLVDCYVAPLLLRLPKYDIRLPDTANPIKDYAKRIFTRPSFQASLSDVERELMEEYDLK
jgi:RNA polymerase-associated protein